MCSNCPRAAFALCGLTRIHTRIPIQQKLCNGKNSSFNITLFFSDFTIMSDQSLYISHVVSNFYGTEIQIWAGFRPVSITEKTILS
jgi:hypothetical protein